MRASMRCTTSFSPRSKNMPSLVRSTFSVSPPVLVSTVSERDRRWRAAAISASHSSADSRLPNTTMRGCLTVCTTCTRRSPASRYSGEFSRFGPGMSVRAGASAPAAASPRLVRSTSASAASVASSRQPAACIDWRSAGTE